LGPVNPDELRSAAIGFVAHLDPETGKATSTELANFDSDHRSAPGDLVNAVLQPGKPPTPSPAPAQPPREAQRYYGQSGDDGESGSSTEPGAGSGPEPTPDPPNSIRNAEAIAMKALATHLGRPIEVRYSDGSTVTHGPAGADPQSPVRVDATPLPNGRSAFSAAPSSSLLGAVSGLPDAVSSVGDRSGQADPGGSSPVAPRVELPRSGQSHRDVAEWVGDVNNDGDRSVVPAGERLTNCGPTTWVVFDRLSGTPSFGRAHPVQLRAEDVGDVTGLPLQASDPDAIADQLRDAGVGAHTVVAARFGNGVAHSFNVMFDGDGVWAIDGQHGTITAWPPSLGREGNPVTGWFAGTPASQSSQVEVHGDGSGLVHGVGDPGDRSGRKHSRASSPGSSEAGAPKRARMDSPDGHVDSDVEMADEAPDTDALTASLDELRLSPDITFNGAFERLVHGASGEPITVQAQAAHLQDSVQANRPISFVANTILPVSDIGRVPAVVDAILK
ncbi:MAG: toxin glutamine deamidase domain-containing protein, partial [Mycobacterium sp.]